MIEFHYSVPITMSTHQILNDNSLKFSSFFLTYCRKYNNLNIVTKS